MAKKELDVTPVEMHGVFYTDGGSRPNPGFAGWGIHGYLYDAYKDVHNPGKHNAPTTRGYVEHYTDASQGKPVKIVNYVDCWGTHPHATNNEMELEAYTKALEFIRVNGIKKARVFMDSNYVLEGTKNHYDTWKANNWLTTQGKPPKNLDKWHKLKALESNLDEKGYKITLDWVKGHIGLLGNTRADELATRGIFAARNEVDHESMEISPVAGYNTPTVDLNSLVTRNRWYFTTGQDDPIQFEDGRFLYITGYHGKPPISKKEKSKDDDEEVDESFSNYRPPDSINWGVSQPDTYFGLVLVKDRIELLDRIQKIHNQRCPDDHQKLVVGNLATILNSKQYNILVKEAEMLLARHTHMNMLVDTQGKYVTWEIYPQRRAYLAHERFETYRDLLARYIKGELVKTDITDLIYEGVEKKKKIVYKVKDELPSSCKFIDIKVNVVVDGKASEQLLRLTFNIDLPVRNHLLRMTEDGTIKPIVNIVTWAEGKCAYSYAVVFERGEDILFWISSDANLRII